MRASFFSLTLGISLCSSLCFSQQKYQYQSCISGDTTLTNWAVIPSDQSIAIKGENLGNAVELDYSSAYELKEFNEVEPTKATFHVKRQGDALSVVNQGKNTSLTIGPARWIQEFKFGFKPFLESAEKKIDFVIVYKKDTSIHEMVATKEKIETLHVEGKEYSAQKLKITLAGFRKRFWKAEVWYDTHTHMLIKYKANEGPGTPMKEVTLLPWT